ncbi:hypothetical protein D3C80_1669420 [compost metagenome]
MISAVKRFKSQSPAEKETSPLKKLKGFLVTLLNNPPKEEMVLPNKVADGPFITSIRSKFDGSIELYVKLPTPFLTNCGVANPLEILVVLP